MFFYLAKRINPFNKEPNIENIFNLFSMNSTRINNSSI